MSVNDCFQATALVMLVTVAGAVLLVYFLLHDEFASQVHEATVAARDAGDTERAEDMWKTLNEAGERPAYRKLKSEEKSLANCFTAILPAIIMLVMVSVVLFCRGHVE